MKYILSVILSFLAGCLVIVTVYNYKDKEIVIQKETVINKNNTIKTAIDKVYDSVLTILGYTDVDSPSTIGSAFIYKVDEEYAYILTNYHVIKDLTKIEVRNIDLVIKEAEIVGFDEYTDVAVLKTDKSISKSISVLSDSSNIELGDTVFTVGSPLSEDYYGTVTKGIISYENRRITTKVNEKDVLIDTIQTSTTINPGNSGGPLVNVNGEVIGINSLKLAKEEIEGMGFAIAIEDVMVHLDILEKGKKIQRPLLGISMVNVTDKYYLYQLGINIDTKIATGVVVTSVEKNSSVAGILKTGDVVIKLNNEQTPTLAYLRYQLYRHKIGDEITITYIRDGQEITSNLTLKGSN